MSQKVTEYLAATKKLAQAKQLVNAITLRIDAVAQRLNAKDYHFSFANSGTSYPLELLAAMRNTIMDKGEWPDASMIQAAVISLLTARVEAQQAWSAVPQTDRVGLAPPEE